MGTSIEGSCNENERVKEGKQKEKLEQNKELAYLSRTLGKINTKVPIEDMQKRFWRVHERIARIWEQFFKAYYRFDIPYAIENENGQETDVFNGSIYQNMDFETTVDVGPGSAYSESLSINLLESALQRGDITFDDYIDLYPDTAMPFKAKLKEIRKKQLLPPDVSQKIAQNPQILQYVMQIIGQAETPAPTQQNIEQNGN